MVDTGAQLIGTSTQPVDGSGAIARSEEGVVRGRGSGSPPAYSKENPVFDGAEFIRLNIPWEKIVAGILYFRGRNQFN